jgi:hypothetical protein
MPVQSLREHVLARGNDDEDAADINDDEDDYNPMHNEGDPMMSDGDEGNDDNDGGADHMDLGEDVISDGEAHPDDIQDPGDLEDEDDQALLQTRRIAALQLQADYCRALTDGTYGIT